MNSASSTTTASDPTATLMKTLDFSKFHRENIRTSFLKPKQLELLKGSEAPKPGLAREIEGSTIEEVIGVEREQNLADELNRKRFRRNRSIVVVEINCLCMH